MESLGKIIKFFWLWLAVLSGPLCWAKATLKFITADRISANKVVAVFNYYEGGAADGGILVHFRHDGESWHPSKAVKIEYGGGDSSFSDLVVREDDSMVVLLNRVDRNDQTNKMVLLEIQGEALSEQTVAYSGSIGSNGISLLDSPQGVLVLFETEEDKSFYRTTFVTRYSRSENKQTLIRDKSFNGGKPLKIPAGKVTRQGEGVVDIYGLGLNMVLGEQGEILIALSDQDRESDVWVARISADGTKVNAYSDGLIIPGGEAWSKISSDGKSTFNIVEVGDGITGLAYQLSKWSFDKVGPDSKFSRVELPPDFDYLPRRNSIRPLPTGGVRIILPHVDSGKVEVLDYDESGERRDQTVLGSLLKVDCHKLLVNVPIQGRT